jgi:hypothetical protein
MYEKVIYNMIKHIGKPIESISVNTDIYDSELKLEHIFFNNEKGSFKDNPFSKRKQYLENISKTSGQTEEGALEVWDESENYIDILYLMYIWYHNKLAAWPLYEGYFGADAPQHAEIARNKFIELTTYGLLGVGGQENSCGISYTENQWYNNMFWLKAPSQYAFLAPKQCYETLGKMLLNCPTLNVVIQRYNEDDKIETNMKNIDERIYTYDRCNFNPEITDSNKRNEILNKFKNNIKKIENNYEDRNALLEKMYFKETDCDGLGYMPPYNYTDKSKRLRTLKHFFLNGWPSKQKIILSDCDIYDCYLKVSPCLGISVEDIVYNIVQSLCFPKIF